MADQFRYRSVLMATDFATPSRVVLRRSMDLAKRLGAKLELVHVVEKLEPMVPFSAANRAAVKRIRTATMEEAKERLDAMVPKRSSVPIRTHVQAGTASAEILRVAKRTKADLIVLGNRGHSSIEELLIGSTADRVLRKSSVPVLLVPAASKSSKRRR